MGKNDFSSELVLARTTIHRLLQSARSLDPLRLVFVAPVIDRQTGSHGMHGTSNNHNIAGRCGNGFSSRSHSNGRDGAALEGYGYGLWKGEDVQGLKKFVDGLSQHAASLDAMAASGFPPKEDPYPIIAGLMTFWKQVLIARGPIPAIRLAVKGKGKAKEGFVDVVARGGEEWIRIYSKKVTQLLAEFREQDSYLNSDFSDSDWDEDEQLSSQSAALNLNGESGPSRSRGGLTNSIITTVDSLLAQASTFERMPGSPIPRLTLRLSRIVEFPEEGHPDPRIAETFEAVRARGVNLVFGDLGDIDLDELDAAYSMGCTTKPGYRPWDYGVPQKIDHVKENKADGELDGTASQSLSSSLKRAELLPSIKINLDPSAMIGLCSDLLHHPLPPDEATAKSRFFRPPEYVHEWKSRQLEYASTGDANGGGNDDEDSGTFIYNGVEISADAVGQSQNSRELVRGLVEEMRSSLVAEIRDALTKAVALARGYSMEEMVGKSDEDSGVEFWATRDTVKYVQETISCEEVVGDGMEQRRMKRLTGMEEGDFWEGSRHKGFEGVLKNLRVKVFDEDDWPREVTRDTIGELKSAKGSSESHSTHDGSANSDPKSSTRPLREPKCRTGMRSFQISMSNVCRQFLSEYQQVTTDPSPNPLTLLNLPNFLQPRRLPTPRVAQVSIPFPVVSLASLERGAREGMTTLLMGNVVFRELFAQTRWRLRGWSQGNYEVEARDEELEWARKEKEGEAQGEGVRRERSKPHAAVWILPYRSLGEGKRVRFEKGDFSYPERRGSEEV